MCLFWKVTCNFLCQIILNNFFGKLLQHCAGVCDLYSGQMMAVSAEIGAENKTTCLETRKSMCKQLEALPNCTSLCRENGGKKARRYTVRNWRKHELRSQTVFCNLSSTQPLVCKCMAVFSSFVVHSCVSVPLVFSQAKRVSWGMLGKTSLPMEGWWWPFTHIRLLAMLCQPHHNQSELETRTTCLNSGLHILHWDWI